MFRLERPAGRDAPVLVEVPHAGMGVPQDARASLMIDAATLRRDADSYVDELYRDAPSRGVGLLVAELSRYVVDLNREETDVDEWSVREGVSRREQFPRGVIWRETGDGRTALRAALSHAEYESRLERYYRPYHASLARELRTLHARHGRVLLVSAHSMPGHGHATHGKHRVRRADVVPGTRGRTTAASAIVDVVESYFRSAGLSVRHDDPYRGGATTARWGRPAEGFHALQIELNRALYMDERTCEPRPDGVEWLAVVCAGLVERLGEMLEAVPF